jgi:hypothetical protein
MATIYPIRIVRLQLIFSFRDEKRLEIMLQMLASPLEQKKNLCISGPKHVFIGVSQNCQGKR